jgi:60 kDa SS-A/Ro ribonucleoprotein
MKLKRKVTTMANKNLFKSTTAKVSPTATNRTHAKTPAADTVNSAGGAAYLRTEKSALAQIAVTNCFNGTFYATAEQNLELAKKSALALKNDPEFIAKTAIYCRDKAYMKDMPAFLTAFLATIDSKLFRKVFPIVINNGKMLRNFVQIGRSGAVGKVINMSSGAVRHAIRDWFASKDPEFIFRASIGNDPSMRDILRMCRPKPENDTKAALYAYLKGAEYVESERMLVTRNRDKSIKYSNSFDALPAIVKQYESFKKTHKGEIPNVDFRMLDSVLTKDELKKLWASTAQNSSWTTTRMNLNNFEKYGVFTDTALVDKIASRLSDKDQVAKAKCYPYQLMMAYNATESNSMPTKVKNSIQDAMEHSIDNVPVFKGKTVVCVDTSGSMSSPITGNRVGATTKVRCVDVASLFACSVLRKNQESEIIPFDQTVHKSTLNPRDTVITNSAKLAKFGGGGTDCACAIRELNKNKKSFDTIIFVSDNESWVDGGYSYKGTGLLNEWNIFKSNNPKAKLVCIDLTPGSTSQVKPHKDILQVGGWSDSVFDVIASFIEYGDSQDHWVNEIEKVTVG